VKRCGIDLGGGSLRGGGVAESHLRGQSPYLHESLLSRAESGRRGGRSGRLGCLCGHGRKHDVRNLGRVCIFAIRAGLTLGALRSLSTLSASGTLGAGSASAERENGHQNNGHDEQNALHGFTSYKARSMPHSWSHLTNPWRGSPLHFSFGTSGKRRTRNEK